MIQLIPYKDGRVEIPQILVKAFNHKMGYVNVFRNNNNLYISANNNYRNLLGFIGRIKINEGRIRVPLSFLKQNQLDGKIVSVDMSEMLGYKALVVTKSSNSKNIKNSRDILSLPERNKPFIFRVIGQPFKFMACLEPVEPVTNSFWLKPKFDIRVVNFSGNENEVRQDAHLFYLIPIIYESEPKYLLVNYHTFNKLNRYAVSRMNNVYECEIILISSSLVYKNPPSYINEEELKEAQDALGGPELFLAKCFQEAENKCYTKYMPSIITKEIFV